MTRYRIIKYNGEFAVEQTGMFGLGWSKVISIGEMVITFENIQEAAEQINIWKLDEKENGKVVKDE
jgi:hypothetical protein